MSEQGPDLLGSMRELWAFAARTERQNARLMTVMTALGGVAGTAAGAEIIYSGDHIFGGVFVAGSVYFSKKGVELARSLRKHAAWHQELAETPAPQIYTLIQRQNGH